MKQSQIAAERHPFLRRPNRTILSLSLPILLSLVAEPVTGLVDTAFVAQLGAIPLAALGSGHKRADVGILDIRLPGDGDADGCRAVDRAWRKRDCAPIN